VQEQIDIGALTPEQAERGSIRNFITRAIGHKDEIEEDLFERELEVGDVLLLCSDGLHGQIRESEIAQIVTAIPNLQAAAQQMVDLANERGGPDNISVMLIRVQELGDQLPPVLNGREASYRTIYSQPTEPIGAPLSSPDTLTDPGTTKFRATKSPELEVQPTKPMAIPAEPRKPGGKGLLVGLLVLLIIVASTVTGVILMSGANNSTSPTALPASNATPIVTVLATVTPLPNSTTPYATTTANGSPDSNTSTTTSATSASVQNPGRPDESSGNAAQMPSSARATTQESDFKGDLAQIRTIKLKIAQYDPAYSYKVKFVGLDSPNWEELTTDSKDLTLSNELSYNREYVIQVQKQSRAADAPIVTIDYLLNFNPNRTKVQHSSNLQIQPSATTLTLTMG
jgi:PPM family protein phosphatase